MPHSDQLSSDAEPRVVVGWTHHRLPHGIELRIESVRSTAALHSRQVELDRLCMTRNQALLLARYLLQVTGQSLTDQDTKPKRRWFGRRRTQG